MMSACGADSGQPAIDTLVEIESPAAGSAGEPNLTRAPGGTIYISWIELQSDSTHVLRFASWKDSKLAQPRTIASGAHWFVNWADFPMMAVLADGTLAAHWLQRSDTGRYTYDVAISTSRDGGQTWSPAIKPHRDTTRSEHGFVSMFALGDRFGAVWLDGRKHASQQKGDGHGEGGAMTLRFTTFSPSGELGEDIEIDGRVCDCCQTSVALTSEGPLLVYRDRSAAEIRDIHVTRYVNGAWLTGRPIQADNWRVDYCPVNGPSAAA
ncbi:MAG: sialidase family protein, partial [Longimicrobiales bacterium]